VQQSFLCPRCGNPVVFGVRFCGNCGTFLTWPAKQSNRRHFTFISLTVVAVLVVALVTGIIIELNSPSQAPGSSTISKSIPQPQPQSPPPSVPQPLPLTTPVLLSPGINTDPGQPIDTLTPSLQWNKVPDADFYSLIISRFPYNADNTVCTPARLEGTSLTVPGGLLEYGQKYRWAIEAHNSTSISSVSNALYFQTPQPPSNSSTPTVPSNQQASTPASPAMAKPPWTPVNLPGFSP
jgi:hypothetical protein